MSTTNITDPLFCRRCGGRLEASAKLYFQLTGAERLSGGELAVTGMEIAESNDSFDGHPVAMESELVVSCADCGERVDCRLVGPALARAVFHRGVPEDPELLLAMAREIYHGAREGQAAVEAWARGPRVARHVSYSCCDPCEALTPHIAGTCAVCESGGGGPAAGAGR